MSYRQRVVRTVMREQQRRIRALGGRPTGRPSRRPAQPQPRGSDIRK